MNRSYVSAIALTVATLASGHALALEAGDRGLGLTNDFGQPIVSASQLTRAQVQADTLRAVAAGQIVANGDRDASVPTVAARSVSSLTREAVRAEARSAATAERVSHL